MDERFIGNLVGAAVLCCAVILGWFWVDDRGGVTLNYNSEKQAYAATFFEGLFPYNAVLASQKWNPRGAASWECTFAVVSLTADAPVDPGARDRSVLGWQFAWGGDWQPTPAMPLGDSTRNAVAFCARRLPEGLGLRLQTALQSDGNLFVRDRIGETVMIYAPADGLAARVRYGD